ncbi:MAG: carbon-nitrogen hydrolase family protein [Deltaproteobacteria bacterium]|nr:carbon-nitrogen hydrolase family protein [Deltaproteobacteria bacterium]
MTRCADLWVGSLWLCCALACASVDVAPTSKPLEPPVEAISFGQDAGAGNLLLVQPFLYNDDYASAWLFSAKIENYLELAKKKGWLNQRTVVVLPAMIGTWLIAADESPTLVQARSFEDVKRLLQSRLWFDYWTQMPFAPASEKSTHTTFALKSSAMAQSYQNVFGKIAIEYGVTVVAGSIVLLEPRLDGNELVVDTKGRLREVALVFGPDGRIVGGPVPKAYLDSVEQGYLQPGDLTALPVIETAAGKLGLLIGSDAWYPDGYAALKQQGVELVVALGWLPVNGGWQQPWPGYRGAPQPSDVAAADVGTLSYRDAWAKYGLPGRLATSGAGVGAAVYSRGRVWDLEMDGQAAAIKGGSAHEIPQLAGPLLVNLWLGEAAAASQPPPPEVAPAPPPPPPSGDDVKPAKKKKKGGKKKSRKR